MMNPPPPPTTRTRRGRGITTALLLLVIGWVTLRWNSDLTEIAAAADRSASSSSSSLIMMVSREGYNHEPSSVVDIDDDVSISEEEEDRKRQRPLSPEKEKPRQQQQQRKEPQQEEEEEEESRTTTTKREGTGDDEKKKKKKNAKKGEDRDRPQPPPKKKKPAKLPDGGNDNIPMCNITELRRDFLRFLPEEEKKKKRRREEREANDDANDDATAADDDDDDGPSRKPSCAVLFFGLPRSFKRYVLPSIVENVFRPNARYGCDYYLHYHSVSAEGRNRKGEKGGEIRGEDVYLLPDALRTVHEEEEQVVLGGHHDARPRPRPPPLFSITSTTGTDFEVARNSTLRRYETTLDDQGRYLYYPWARSGWEYPVSIHNIVKQWDSIERVWSHMVETASSSGEGGGGEKQPPPYDRIAMLRSDVMYVTPHDVFETPGGGGGEDGRYHTSGNDNDAIVVPGFARFPVNDRMVTGPYEAVKVWATKRFELIDEHVRTNADRGLEGQGMHGETFLAETIFPAMRRAGRPSSYRIEEHPLFCFLRARSDGVVWKQDCRESSVLNGCDLASEIESIVSRGATATTTATASNHTTATTTATVVTCRRVPGQHQATKCETEEEREESLRQRLEKRRAENKRLRASGSEE